MVTELHFSSTQRFTLEHAAVDVPIFTRLLQDSGFVPVASRANPGWPLDRVIDPALQAVGMATTHCCRELSLVREELLG